MLVRKNLDSVDGRKSCSDLEDGFVFEDDRDTLFGAPDWTLDELQPSVCGNVRFSERSAFDDVKTACAAGSIGIPVDVHAVIRHASRGKGNSQI